MRWSSGVVASLVTERVIHSLAANDLYADLVRCANGNFSGTLQPPLSDTVLVRTGVGDDPDTSWVHGDGGGAQWAGYLDAAIS